MGGGGRLLQAAAVVALVVGVAAVTLSPDGTDDLVTTVGSTANDTPADVPVIGDSWEIAPGTSDVFTPSDLVVTVGDETGSTIGISQIVVADIVAASDGFVAVGSEQIGFMNQAAVWMSDDSFTWSRFDQSNQAFNAEGADPDVLGTPGLGMTAVAADGAVVVAVGNSTTQDSQPMAWVSTPQDGWQRIELPSSPEDRSVRSIDVVRTATGFVVVGMDTGNSATDTNNRVVVWTSVNGVEWSRVDPGFERGDQVQKLAVIGERIVAVGQTGLISRPEASAWYSDDSGLTWQPSLFPEAPSDRPMTAVVDVAVGPDGLVAVGTQTTNGGVGTEQDDGDSSVRVLGRQDTLIWSSQDGAEWQVSGEVRASEQIALQQRVAVNASGTLITFTSVTSSGERVETWVSPDSSTFSLVEAPRGDGWVWVVTAANERFIAIASTAAFDRSQGFGPGPGPSLEVWHLPTN